MSMIQQHRLLARPGLQKDFKDTYDKWETIYTQYMKVGTHDKPEISAATIAGPNRLIQTGRELEPVTYMEVVTGPKVMAVDKTYKGGYYLSKEAIDDDGYNKLNQGAKWLAEAAHYTIEYACSAMIDDAFSGTNFKGMDNLAMYSTAHTLINSTATVANRPTTALSLSVASITALLDLGRKMKNESGDPLMVNYDTIMIGNDQGQIHKLHQILESTLEPFTANNQDNPIRRNFKPTRVVINPYMTNAYHFHMISTKLNDAQFLFREKVTMTDWYDNEVDASKIRARGRWIIWFRDWRAWVGTNPSA
jgi:hypothetical protein